MSSSTILRTLVLAVACTLSLAAYAAETPKTVNVVAGELTDALEMLARQCGVDVIYPSSQLKGLKTAGVSGVLEIREAFEKLIEGTRLVVKEEGGAVLIALPGSASKPTAEVSASGPNIVVAQTAATKSGISGESEKEIERQKEDSLPQDEGNSQKTDEEVVITGTHIRGAPLVGSQLIVVTQDDIQRSGFTRTEEVLRSLPQNFNGGPSEDVTASVGQDAISNFTKGTSPNLRGLGAGSTLVLIDGHRLASGGDQGLFTDISSIPLSAVERVEVLPDGASALYGSDAVGGVVNFILRKNYTGAETVLSLGTADGADSGDYQIGQTFGSNWRTGRALLSYEYLQKQAIMASERPFASNSDKRILGGSNFSSLNNNPGTIRLGSETWAIPEGQDGRSLDPESLLPGVINFRNIAENTSLTPGQRRHSVFGVFSQDLGASFTLLAQGLLSERKTQIRNGSMPTTLTVFPINPFYVNPTGGSEPIELLYDLTQDFGSADTEPEVKSYGSIVGVTGNVGADWTIQAELGYARNDEEQRGNQINFAALFAALSDPSPETAFNPFGDGSETPAQTLNSIRAVAIHHVWSDVRSAYFKFSGPILQMPAGSVQFATGLQYQEYNLSSRPYDSNLPVQRPESHYGRSVRAVFSELLVPLIGESNSVFGVERLTASIAGRHEEYSDFGASTVPKLGLSWLPISGITVRGTWSKSFKAPTFTTLDGSNNRSFILPIFDPNQPGNIVSVMIWSGGNPDLQPESANTWTIGFELAPKEIPGLTIGVTHFDTNFTNRIGSPFAGIDLVSALHDPTVAGLVTANPTGEQQHAVCSRSTFFGPQDECLNRPVDVLMDTRVQNSAATNAKGIDLIASVNQGTEIGSFSYSLNATYMYEFSQAITSSSPLVDRLNTRDNPVDMRARASISWENAGLGVTAFANYVDNYKDTNSTPSRRIDSWLTFDLSLSYEATRIAQAFKNILVTLSAQNVFNESPPFVNSTFGYDGSNAQPHRRIIALHARKNW